MLSLSTLESSSSNPSRTPVSWYGICFSNSILKIQWHFICDSFVIIRQHQQPEPTIDPKGSIATSVANSPNTTEMNVRMTEWKCPFLCYSSNWNFLRPPRLLPLRLTFPKHTYIHHFVKCIKFQIHFVFPLVLR